METNTARYAAAARRAPVLDRQQESELVNRWRDTGDQRAADMLARAQQRLVITLALKYRHYQISVGELVAEGNLGLVRALRAFDPERGVRFATYASHWVRAHMLSYVVRWSTVTSSSGGPMRTQLFFRVRRERIRAINLFGAGPKADEALANRLGLSLEQTQRLLQRLDARDVPIESSTPTGLSLLDSLPASADQEAELNSHRVQETLEHSVQEALAALNARELYIVRRRSMASAEDALSLAEIARRFEISRERARQLEGRAMQKLKRRLGASASPVLAEWITEVSARARAARSRPGQHAIGRSAAGL